MPTTFAQFKEEVLALYNAKKIKHELDDLLANPSPANLRNYCLVRLSEKLSDNDLDILQKFFDPYKKEKNLQEAISRFNIGSLKASQKFILGKTENPDELLVKVLAILVDYQPRPFRYDYNESFPNVHTSSHELAGESVPLVELTKDMHDSLETIDRSKDTGCETLNLPEPVKSLDEIAKPKDTFSEINNGGKKNEIKAGFSNSRSILKGNRHMLRFSGIASLIVGIFYIVYYLTHKGCMCWNGERYIEVDCQDRTQPYQVIGLNKDKLDHFQRITRSDTLNTKDIGRVWYSKIDNEVEFFTGPGFHPVQYNRSLKAASAYILTTRAGANAKTNQHKQYGIRQRQ